jgi:hypothetical protein
MHDSNLEDRLRSVLRAEGDGLSLTITTDELERRLALRRRARNGQRLSLMAAGLAAVAVGSIFAMSNGWLRNTPVIGTDASPSPAPATSPAPSVSPVPSTAAEPSPRVAEPLGASGQAILVTPVGDFSVDIRIEAFEVTRFDPETGASVALATIPGSVIPEDGVRDQEGPPLISATGFLAIPFSRGPNIDDQKPAIAIVDIQSPEADPWIIDGYTPVAWDDTDKLVVERDGLVFVAWPLSREVIDFAFQGAAVSLTPNGIAVQDGARFLATTQDEAQTWGYVGFDGRFTATTDLPPVYQRTGLERPAGAGAHGIGQACDSGPDAASSGCYLIESDADHKPLTTWMTLDNGPNITGLAWGSDGKGLWMMTGGGPATEETTTQTLSYAQAPGQIIELGRVQVGRYAQADLLGIADELSPGSAAVVAVGDFDGFVWGFVLEDGRVVEQGGTGWFAGWAGDQSPYDPD